MFNINQRPEFTRTVTVETPEGDGIRRDTFSATFRWVPSDELAAMGGDTTEDIKSMLRHVVVRCDELIDDNGEALPWSPDLLEQLMGWSNVRLAMLTAFNMGWVEAREKN